MDLPVGEGSTATAAPRGARASDLPTWLIHRPGDPSARVVISAPHVGLFWPDELGPPPPVDLGRHADLAVDRLYPDGVAELVSTRISRLVVDLNRAPDDVSSTLVADHPKPRPRGRAGDPTSRPRPGPVHYGVVWSHSLCARPLHAAGLSYRALLARLSAYHQPYLALVAARLRHQRDRHGSAVLIDAHSMPSGVGVDVVLGTLGGRSCSARTLARAHSALTRFGWRVAIDAPYRGGAIVERFGRPDLGIEAVQVEVNRALYMDEDQLALWSQLGPAGGPRLACGRADQARLMSALAAMVDALARE